MLKVVSTYRLKKGRFEDNFLVFEMDGEQYIREWTSLTGERVKNDPAFSVTMAYANVQTLASQTSSWVYEQVTGERHVYALYVLLKKIAYQLFKKGYAIEVVYSWLREAVDEQGFWWEEWSEGKQAKAVVEEISKELIRRNVMEQPVAARRGVEEEGKHLGHKEALSTTTDIEEKSLPRISRIATNEEMVNKQARLYVSPDGFFVAVEVFQPMIVQEDLNYG